MLCQEQLSLDRPVLPLLHLPPSESSKSSGSKIRKFHEAFDSPFVFSADVRCFLPVALLCLVRAGYNCDSWLFRHTWCFIGWTWLNIFWTSWEVGNEGEMKVKWRWQCFTCFTSWVSSFTESKGASICDRRRSAARPRCRPKCFNHHMDVEHVVFPKNSPGIWVEQW